MAAIQIVAETYITSTDAYATSADAVDVMFVGLSLASLWYPEQGSKTGKSIVQCQLCHGKEITAEYVKGNTLCMDFEYKDKCFLITRGLLTWDPRTLLPQFHDAESKCVWPRLDLAEFELVCLFVSLGLIVLPRAS